MTSQVGLGGHIMLGITLSLNYVLITMIKARSGGISLPCNCYDVQDKTHLLQVET